MARRSGSTILQEELYPPAEELAREDLDNARSLDLDARESPFLRAQKRVSARRNSLPKRTLIYLTWTGVLVVALLVLVAVSSSLYHYGELSWRFRIDSSDEIEITGLHNVMRQQVIEVMGGDIGRNIFFVPLAQRQKQLEQIPWVRTASIMRFAPNRLKIEIQERTPIAFARVGSRIFLTDAEGALMDLPIAGRNKYSFPVILGMSQAEPRSMRASRMKTYSDLVSQLDSEGAHYSQDLSETDLSDPDDVRVVVNDPAGEVLVHLGSANYLERYKIYVSHVRDWRQQFAKLDSVDLRYDRQIIVNPDLQGVATQSRLPAAVVKSAIAAGVKPAALVETATNGGRAKEKGEQPANKKLNRVALKKQSAQARHKKASVKQTKSSVPVPSTNVDKSSLPAAQGGAAQSNPGATIAPNTGAAKTAGKPSPAIPKGQGPQ